jgi:hypothetical protein
LLINGRCI